jgi:hypothetical protein
MAGAGFKTILIAAALLGLAACSKRDSLYLDHTREPAKHAPARPAATAATNTAKAPAT